MKRLTHKQKKWLVKHCYDVLSRMSELKKIKKIEGLEEQKNNSQKRLVPAKTFFKRAHQKTFIAPKCFSIINATEETISFYNTILKEKNCHHIGTHFYIDSSNVTEVTVDALLYLIAIIQCTKFNIVHKYRFSGNFPRNTNAKRIYVECGFLDFVTSNNKQSPPRLTDKIQIRIGKDVNPYIAKDICTFAKQYGRIDNEGIAKFYPILIELMSNTIQHAYKELKEIKVAKDWYVFLDYRDNEIHFVFLDTGSGIPATVHKTINEKLTDNSLGRLLGLVSDSEFIQSTLDGTFRTETKLENRGQGLPQIADCFKSGIFTDVFVFSGHGLCTLAHQSNKTFLCKDYEEQIFGTLFSWKLQRKDI